MNEVCNTPLTTRIRLQRSWEGDRYPANILDDVLFRGKHRKILNLIPSLRHSCNKDWLRSGDPSGAQSTVRLLRCAIPADSRKGFLPLGNWTLTECE